jgi:hypothetical protein
LPAFKLSGIVNRHNVWMVQRGGHFRLTLESAPRRRVSDSIGNEFDGHCPIELRIDGPIHDTHTAFSERRFDAIGS